MIGRVSIWIVVLLWAFGSADCQETLTKEQILQNILRKAEQNEKLIEDYGYSIKSTERKLKEDGTVKEEKTRTYKIVWIQDEAYAQLIEIDGKKLDAKQMKEEEKRRRDFEKKLKTAKDKDSEDDFEWKDLYEKYDFSELSPEQDGAYTLAFEPKRNRVRERNRMEKILNHLKGTFRADKDFNLLNVQASLNSPVRFALGLLAKIDSLDIEYAQQRFENVSMPSLLRYKFTGRLAVFRSERREHIAEFYAFSHRD